MDKLNKKRKEFLRGRGRQKQAEGTETRERTKREKGADGQD